MNIPPLGPLHPDAQIPEWLVSGSVNVPYFDGQALEFTLEGLTDADEPEAQSAVEAFLALDAAARLSASPFVFQNYRKMADRVGEDQMDCRVGVPEEVWVHVQPTGIVVSRRHRRERAIYVQITTNCDWEPEHGLQIVYRRGRELARVSDYDGHLTHADAYGLPEEQDRIVG